MTLNCYIYENQEKYKWETPAHFSYIKKNKGEENYKNIHEPGCLQKMIMTVLNRKDNPFGLEICIVANGCQGRPLTTTMSSEKCQKGNMEIFYEEPEYTIKS